MAISGPNHPPDDNDELSTSVHSPRLMPLDEIPDSTPSELLQPSNSNGNDGNQEIQLPTPVAATNVTDDLEEEMIFAMSPHEENGPSAPGVDSSSDPMADIYQAMVLRPHKQRALVASVADIPRSDPSARDIVPPAVPTRYLGPGPGEQARSLALVGILGGDGAVDTAGIHPSECPKGRGTKRKGSWNKFGELLDRMISRKKKSKDEGKGPKKEDEQ